jgi:hypothetical protein
MWLQHGPDCGFSLAQIVATACPRLWLRPSPNYVLPPFGKSGSSQAFRITIIDKTPVLQIEPCLARPHYESTGRQGVQQAEVFLYNYVFIHLYAKVRPTWSTALNFLRLRILLKLNQHLSPTLVQSGNCRKGPLEQELQSRLDIFGSKIFDYL